PVALVRHRRALVRGPGRHPARAHRAGSRGRRNGRVVSGGNCMHIRKVTMPRLTRQDFERLLEFRVTLRRFHRWSEDQAQAEGLTHVQHQLLVAIKGHHGNQPPTMGDLAGYLMLRPHSTVELVDRAEAAELVERTPDGEDGRVVRVRLTRDGDRVLNKLTRAHLERLRELATVLDEL